jgi:hypothetical protein
MRTLPDFAPGRYGLDERAEVIVEAVDGSVPFIPVEQDASIEMAVGRLQK